jgi:hypothetical protein
MQGERHPSWPRRTGGVLATLACGLALTTGAATGQAGSTISLSVSPAPEAALEPLGIMASGLQTDGMGDDVEVSDKAAGGTCAAAPASDTGTMVPVLVNDPDTVGEASPYTAFASSTESGQPIALPAGSYLLCGWLTNPNDDSVVASTSSPLTIAPFHGAITFTGLPKDVLTKAQTTGRVNWSVNAPSYVSIALQNPYMKHPSAPCPDKPLQEAANIDGISASSWEGTVGFQAGDVDTSTNQFGPATFSDGSGAEKNPYVDYLYDAVDRALIEGPYRVCAWITSDMADQHVIYGPVTYAFRVGPAHARTPQHPRTPHPPKG